MDDRSTPRRVELLVPTRTLLKLAVFGALVALAIVALDVLLSIFVAVVLAARTRSGRRRARAPRLEARPRRARGVRRALRRRWR